MSAITCEKAFARQTIEGGNPRIEVYPEAASQTFKKGELVYLVAGYVTACGADPVNILGLAGEDAHNSTAGAYNVAVELAEPTVLFQMNIASSTSAGSLALTQAMLGTQGCLYIDSTNHLVYCKPLTYGSTARIVVEKFIDAVGDTNAKVLVRFLSKFYALYCSS